MPIISSIEKNLMTEFYKIDEAIKNFSSSLIRQYIRNVDGLSKNNKTKNAPSNNFISTNDSLRNSYHNIFKSEFISPQKEFMKGKIVNQIPSGIVVKTNKNF